MFLGAQGLVIIKTVARTQSSDLNAVRILTKILL